MKPTKDELKNAGFNIAKCEKVGIGIPDSLHAKLTIIDIGITINYHTSSGSILVTDGYAAFEAEANTKEELNKALFFWTKKDLDFTKKVKSYTYKDSDKDVAWATYSERLTFNSGKGRNQAEAAAKLSFVVAKINEDFPKVANQGWECFYPELEAGKFCSCGDDKPEDKKISTISRKGCDILKRDNEQLLKQLYGV